YFAAKARKNNLPSAHLQFEINNQHINTSAHQQIVLPQRHRDTVNPSAHEQIILPRRHERIICHLHICNLKSTISTLTHQHISKLFCHRGTETQLIHQRMNKLFCHEGTKE